jgi:hypothetical protein
MSGWNSCLISWFVTSTVRGTVFQRSLKLTVFSYDSQQSVRENAAHSHFPGICNSLNPAKHCISSPLLLTSPSLSVPTLHLKTHQVSHPKTHLKHHNKSQSGSQDVPIHCCFLIFVGRIQSFSVVGISENKRSAHQTSKDYDYEDSSLPGSDTTSMGEWLQKFQVNSLTPDGESSKFLWSIRNHSITPENKLVAKFGKTQNCTLFFY